jgi:hypothetical protein
MGRRDVCPGAYALIPCGGLVRCACGRVWRDRDERGEARFRAPLHDEQGHPLAEEKVAARIDQAVAVRADRRQRQAEREAREEAGRRYVRRALRRV